MPIPGQPPPSPTLKRALGLLAAGKPTDAEDAVKAAALTAKARFGSGSPELARGYADLARVHYRTGDVKKAAAEFKHACEGPLPADPAARADRLAFMFGYAACLERLDKVAEAEKVLRQCAAFARNLHGPASPAAAAAAEPLARLLLDTGNAAEAAKLLDDAYAALWNLGDPLIVAVIPTRAEALKATGRADNPFADLGDLPDDLVGEAVAGVTARSGAGDGRRVRQVLAELLKVLEARYGDAHPLTADVVAVIAHHEARLGSAGDPKRRAVATARAVRAFAGRRLPNGLLARLDVAFEGDGTVHLVPTLTRDPAPAEVRALGTVLAEALDNLYAHPARPA